MKDLLAPCAILVTAKSAKRRLGKLADSFHADSATPWAFRCQRCKLEWSDPPYTGDWTGITCSNCYSERVILSSVRLDFFDWGEQNGGKRERMERYRHAKQMLAAEGRR